MYFELWREIAAYKECDCRMLRCEIWSFTGTKRPVLGRMSANDQEVAVCVQNSGFGASLELRKLYAVVRDPDAEANNLIRIVDESGEDYIYPASMFQRLWRCPAMFNARCF